MKTRMEKYYNEVPEETTPLSRSQRNVNLYREVNNSSLDDFSPNSNATVIKDNTKNISLEEIQELINKKYGEENKRKTNIDIEPLPERKISLDETREYDVNAILDKARETKTTDYEVDRLKKLKNTQYDILNNLDLEPEKEEVEDVTLEQAKLMDLINTITSKEMAQDIQKKLSEEKKEPVELDPLDLFSDLKGDDDATTTLGALKEELLEEAKINSKSEEVVENKPEEKKESLDVTAELKLDEKQLSDTLNTNSMQFSQSDFDDFNDLKDDMKAAKIIIKILIALIVIAFICGCLFLVNNIFDLGLLK